MSDGLRLLAGGGLDAFSALRCSMWRLAGRMRRQAGELVAPLAQPLEHDIERRNIPRSEAASMPPATPVPTARRLSMPAPSAVTSGISPTMKAKLVIITARKRVRAPSTAASTMVAPFSRWNFANSTIRIAFFEASAIKTTRPIWA